MISKGLIIIGVILFLIDLPATIRKLEEMRT